MSSAPSLAAPSLAAPRGPPPMQHARGPRMPQATNQPAPSFAGPAIPVNERLGRYSQYNKGVRELVEVCHRYPKIPLSGTFLTSTVIWPSDPKVQQQVNLSTPVNFHADVRNYIEPEDDPTSVNTTDNQPTEPRTIVRAILLSGSPQQEEGEEPAHLTKAVKMLVGKQVGGGLFAFGGPWVKGKHGQKQTEQSLHKAAIDYTKQQCGVDLSKCKNWIKFMDFSYRRSSDVVDRTIIYIPDIWNHLAGKEVTTKRVARWTTITLPATLSAPNAPKADGKDDEKDKPAEPKTERKLVTVSRSLFVTLHGLLDYDSVGTHVWKQQTLEAHSEVCMFAEAFAEMISVDNSNTLAEYFVTKSEQIRELKRKREADAIEEQKRKQAKLEEDKKAKEEAEAKAKEEEAAKEGEEKKDEEKKDEGESAEKADTEQKGEEEKKEAGEPEKPKTKTVVTVDTHSRAAFSWFDIPNPVQKGVFRRTQAEQMLHGIGSRTVREVDELLAGIFENNAVVDYRALTETSKVVPVDED